MSDVKRADCRVAYNFEVAPNGAEVWDERPMSEADLDSLIRERGVTDEMLDRAIEAWESAPEYQTVVTTVREMLLAALSGTEGSLMGANLPRKKPGTVALEDITGTEEE